MTTRGRKDTLVSNLVVPPSLKRRAPLSPTLFCPQAPLLTILLCIDYPTPPQKATLWKK